MPRSAGRVNPAPAFTACAFSYQAAESTTSASTLVLNGSNSGGQATIGQHKGPSHMESTNDRMPDNKRT